MWLFVAGREEKTIKSANLLASYEALCMNPSHEASFSKSLTT